MCFSATASFVAGGSLTAIGVATIGQAKRTSELPFASIPLLFGVQQTLEGVLWLSLGHETPGLATSMVYMYSLFSHVFWPIYMPFTILFLEHVRWRRRTLVLFQIVGIAIGLYLLYSLTVRPITADIVDGHIVYRTPHFYIVPVTSLYVVATCLSAGLSSHRFVILFGTLGFVLFVAAYVVHSAALVSIWCFLYAVLSILVYLHLRFRDLGGFPVDAPREKACAARV